MTSLTISVGVTFVFLALLGGFVIGCQVARCCRGGSPLKKKALIDERRVILNAGGSYRQ